MTGVGRGEGHARLRGTVQRDAQGYDQRSGGSECMRGRSSTRGTPATSAGNVAHLIRAHYQSDYDLRFVYGFDGSDQVQTIVGENSSLFK